MMTVAAFALAIGTSNLPAGDDVSDLVAKVSLPLSPSKSSMLKAILSGLRPAGFATTGLQSTLSPTLR
jgi:hypothetical protein